MTLTREEILNQPGGNKLDRWVQEHIFNWVPWAEKRGDYTVVTFQKPGEREPYRGSQNWKDQMERYSVIEYSSIDPMKHAVYGDREWSTDISAAWEVVENNKRWFSLQHNGLEFVCEIGIDAPCKIGAKTAPEAICKAALLAVLNL